MKIYKVTNRITGKSYIGLTSNELYERKKSHFHYSFVEPDNSYFHKAIRKYGKESFEWEILEDNISDIALLKEREIFNILKHDTYIPNGYNSTKGGDGRLGFKATEETKLKLRNAWTDERKKNFSLKMKNRHVSEETKRKMSEAKKGKKSHRRGKSLTDEHKINIGIGNKGRIAWNTGKRLSEETKRKMRESHKKIRNF